MSDQTRKAITVGELITQLQAFDPALPVQTEGCDCIGACDGAELVGQDPKSKDGRADWWEEPYVLVGRAAR